MHVSVSCGAKYRIGVGMGETHPARHVRPLPLLYELLEPKPDGLGHGRLVAVLLKLSACFERVNDTLEACALRAVVNLFRQIRVDC